MALLVQKFGGTSVGSVDRIRNVARRCLSAQRAGNDVVVIVSAMSGETNRLLALAHQVTAVPEAREMDAIAATGEQVTAALTALAIQAEGGKARSLPSAPDPFRGRRGQTPNTRAGGLEPDSARLTRRARGRKRFGAPWHSSSRSLGARRSVRSIASGTSPVAASPPSARGTTWSSSSAP